MQKLKSVLDADVSGKRVLLRVDFNVPLKDSAVVDDTRIKAVVPTIELLHKMGAAQIHIITHIGRPEGKVVEALRVAPTTARLRELTSVPFEMLENLRFDAREDTNDEGFAKELAQLGDMYVNDAFAVSHRAATSIVGVTKFLPAYAGLLMEREVEKLSEALVPPPGSVAIIGGAKFETKQPLLSKLLSLYDTLLLGGALGNDIIKARGLPFGASLVSPMPVPIDIASSERLLMMQDAIVKDAQGDGAHERLINDIRIGEKIVDIGPTTAYDWNTRVAQAPFVLWNGPMGMYEDGYTKGTEAMAQALAQTPGRAVVGGGDTIAAVSKFSFNPEKIFLSTGGGAMLEFLAHGTLPGIEVLLSTPLETGKA